MNTQKTASLWPEWQDKFIIENYGCRTHWEMARELRMTPFVVARRIRQLGLGPRKHLVLRTCAWNAWTDDEDAKLRELFPTMGYKKISETLNRSQKSTLSRIRILGLTRPAPIRCVTPTRECPACGQVSRFCGAMCAACATAARMAINEEARAIGGILKGSRLCSSPCVNCSACDGVREGHCWLEIDREAKLFGPWQCKNCGAVATGAYVLGIGETVENQECG